MVLISRSANVLKYAALTEQIIGAYYAVYNELGHGFLEKVYENAMAIQLTRLGLQVRQQAQIQVYFHGTAVGNYFADLVIEQKVIAEIKAAEAIHEAHKAQLTNYLRATTCEVGFVFNFGPEAAFERRFFGNGKKRGTIR